MPRKIKTNKNILDIAKEIEAKTFFDSIKQNFLVFEDPRVKGKIQYPAWYLLFIIIAGLISGCNSIQDLAYFAHHRHQWIIETIGENCGVPSYDTLWWFLARTRPSKLKKTIQQWFKGLSRSLKKQILAIDGKRLKSGSFLGEPVHLVELFATETGLTLCTEKVPEKTGETKVMSDILSEVNVEGAIISGDALYTNSEVANTIVNAKADYILALKGNQGKLVDEAYNFFFKLKLLNLKKLD